MPRHPLSPSARAKISARMKARWSQAKAQRASMSTNGLHLEQRLILHVQGQELTLTPTEAEHLKDTLNQMLPAKLPISTESA
jgi:hypothetical protein